MPCWSTRLTFTFVWLALYASVSFCRAGPIWPPLPCQNVMLTGTGRRRQRVGGHVRQVSAAAVVVGPATVVSTAPTTAAPTDALVVAPARRAAMTTGAAAGRHASMHDRRRARPRRCAATSTDGSLHPLTAPAVRPRTSWRWKTISTTKIGRAAITVPAVTRLSLSRFADLQCLRARSGWCGTASLLVIRCGQRYWFHAPRNENSASAPIVGRHSGAATSHRKRKWPDTVEGGRLAQLVRHGEEDLTHQERAERRWRATARSDAW